MGPKFYVPTYNEYGNYFRARRKERTAKTQESCRNASVTKESKSWEKHKNKIFGSIAEKNIENFENSTYVRERGSLRWNFQRLTLELSKENFPRVPLLFWFPPKAQDQIEIPKKWNGSSIRTTPKEKKILWIAIPLLFLHFSSDPNKLLKENQQFTQVREL